MTVKNLILTEGGSEDLSLTSNKGKETSQELQVQAVAQARFRRTLDLIKQDPKGVVKKFYPDTSYKGDSRSKKKVRQVGYNDRARAGIQADMEKDPNPYARNPHLQDLLLGCEPD